MRRLIFTVLAAALLASPAHAAEPKKKGGGESFIQLPTLTATIVRANGARGVLTIEVGVDVPDARLRQRAQASIPLLRDAYLREMLAYAPGLAPGGAPSPERIGTQLQRATNQTLHQGGATLLLGSILVN